MNRIVKKILIIAICLAFFAIAAFAAVDTAAFSKVLKKTMDDKIYYETSQFANQLSMIFENAEGSVDALCADVQNEFDLDAQLADSSYIDSYIEEHSPIIRDALIDIEDSQGLFLTFNPAITDREKVYEIWYAYDKDGRMVAADAAVNGIYYEAFDDRSYPTMMYYFNAADSRDEGVWTEPWMDPDINEELITYSRAVYLGDTLIGVLGTDIYTEHTIDLISSMKVEHGGMIFLLDENNDQIISSDNVRQTDILQADEMWADITKNMAGRESGLFDADWNGEPMRVSFSELSNGWKLAALHYEKRMYHSYRNILAVVIVLSAGLIILLMAAMFITLKHFSSPVDKAIGMLKMMDLEHQIEEKDARDIKKEDDIVLIVDKAVKRQRMNDIMLANQSRLAAAGEMMGNVTHQWKQPLNNINIVMGMLKDDIKSGSMSEESALEAISKVERMTTGMSETLSDFSDYLKPDTELVTFSVNHIIQSVMELMKDKIKTRNIAVSVSGSEELYSYGYKNSLYHVILNIVNNAIDAIDAKGAGEGRIEICTCRQDGAEGKIRIEIFNNGVQLTDSEKENLFKPYYTTKGKADGTGLGLAISRHFIEDSMDGEITLENYGDGVRCVMIINEKEDRHDS